MPKYEKKYSWCGDLQLCTAEFGGTSTGNNSATMSAQKKLALKRLTLKKKNIKKLKT